MTRIWTTSLALSVSLVALSACKGPSADAAKLIPNDAQFLGAVSPEKITESELYELIAEDVESQSDYKEMMAEFEECDVDPTQFDAIVGGGNEDGDYVAIIVGQGIGKEDTITCLTDKISKKMPGLDSIKIESNDGQEYFDVMMHRVFLVNKNTIAVASSSWKDEVGELIAGDGESAIDNSLEDLFKRADTRSAAWFIAEAPQSLTDMAKGKVPDADSVKSVVASLDLSKGAAVSVFVGFGDEDEAEKIAEEAQIEFDKAKGEAPEDFASVVESVKIEADDDGVKFSASMSIDEFKKAKESEMAKSSSLSKMLPF